MFRKSKGATGQSPPQLANTVKTVTRYTNIFCIHPIIMFTCKILSKGDSSYHIVIVLFQNKVIEGMGLIAFMLN